MPTDKTQINDGDWVYCDHKYMYVYDVNEDNPETIGLVQKDTKKLYDEHGLPYYEAKYYSVSEVEVLPERDVDESILRRFFRLEVAPWDLCEKGLYPFSDKGVLILNDDDLISFSKNVRHIDGIIFDAWKHVFYESHHVECPDKNDTGLSLKLTWHIMNQTLDWFDLDEDEIEDLIEIINVYCRNKGKTFQELDVSHSMQRDIVDGIGTQDRNDITDDEKEIYKIYLENLYDIDDYNAVKDTAYGYYGGNHLLECDWKKSEEALLRLLDLGEMYAANSLGYIYYSNRLGQPDYENAFHYFSIAANCGITEAQYKLSDLYRKGHGVKKDLDKAFSLLEPLYDKLLKQYQNGWYECSFADVALRMGYCYEQGLGCPQDLIKAKEYFETAKEAIDKRIQDHPHYGDSVVSKNIDESLKRVQEKINGLY